MPVAIPCAYCSKPNFYKPYAAARHPLHFCNKKCKAAYQHDHPRLKHKVTVYCDYCGKPKQVFPSRLNRKHFCNGVCHGKWQTAQQRVKLVCQWCGETYDVAKYFTTVRRSRFCSRRCTYAAVSAGMTGVNNVNWKGGGVNDYGPHWSRIARAIRKRDGHTCQICRKRRRGLDVHHIKPLRDFGGDLDAAHHSQNLITLCRRCHKLAECGKVAIQPRLL